jgi:hypothetical protein
MQFAFVVPARLSSRKSSSKDEMKMNESIKNLGGENSKGIKRDSPGLNTNISPAKTKQVHKKPKLQTSASKVTPRNGKLYNLHTYVCIILEALALEEKREEETGAVLHCVLLSFHAPIS